MHQVINFNETAKLQAKENLNAYILKYQNNFIFPDNQWNDSIWDITNFLKTKIKNHKSKKVYFRSYIDNSENKTSIDIPISKPLIDFVKAAFCEIMLVKKLLEYKRIIYAFQALEHALHQQGH